MVVADDAVRHGQSPNIPCVHTKRATLDRAVRHRADASLECQVASAHLQAFERDRLHEVEWRRIPAGKAIGHVHRRTVTLTLKHHRRAPVRVGLARERDGLVPDPKAGSLETVRARSDGDGVEYACRIDRLLNGRMSNLRISVLIWFFLGAHH